jgi:hypothetical protein
MGAKRLECVTFNAYHLALTSLVGLLARNLPMGAKRLECATFSAYHLALTSLVGLLAVSSV